MTASATSREAYYQHTLKGKTIPQRERILAYVKSCGKASRTQIADAFDARSNQTWDAGPRIPLASVCGRVNALFEDGLLETAGTAVDPQTHQRVELVRATARILRQLDLEL